MGKSRKNIHGRWDLSENLVPYTNRDLWGRHHLELIRCTEYHLDDLPSVRRSKLYPASQSEAAPPTACGGSSAPGPRSRSNSVPLRVGPEIEDQVMRAFGGVACGIFTTASPEDDENASDTSTQMAFRLAVDNKQASSGVAQRIHSRRKNPPNGIPTFVSTNAMSDAAAQEDGTLSSCLGDQHAKQLAVALQNRATKAAWLSNQEFVATVADCLGNPSKSSPEELNSLHEQQLPLPVSMFLKEVRRWTLTTFVKDIPTAVDEAISIAGQEALTPTQWWEFLQRNGWPHAQESAMVAFSEVGEHGLALAGDLLCEEVHRVRSWLIKTFGSRTRVLGELGRDKVTRKRWIAFMKRVGWKGSDVVLRNFFQVFDTSLLGKLPAEQLVGDLSKALSEKPDLPAEKPSGLETHLGQWLKHRMDEWRDVDLDRILRWLLWKYEGEHASVRRELLTAVVRGMPQSQKRSPAGVGSPATGTGRTAKKSLAVMEKVPLHSWLSFLRQCGSPFSRDVLIKFFTIRTSEFESDFVHVDKLLAPAT